MLNFDYHSVNTLAAWGRAPLYCTYTFFAVARLRLFRLNHYMRASNARPYGIACTSDENVGATIGRPLLAAGAMRLEILLIHLLRQHGIENTDQTVAVRYRVGAV